LQSWVPTQIAISDRKASGATFPTDINNVGIIVGDYISGVNPHSFVYIDRGLQGHSGAANGSNSCLSKAFVEVTDTDQLFQLNEAMQSE
jgi:hypothetical protein